MFKMKKIVPCILFGVIFFALSVGFTTVKAAEDESPVLMSPLSFKGEHNPKLMKNAVLIDTIDFELSESNAAITYPIPETDSDLICVFHDVSPAVTMSLITVNDSKDCVACVGFRGKSQTIYAQINPDMEYEIELSRGFVSSDDMKQTEMVDYCSGILEVYQIRGGKVNGHVDSNTTPIEQKLPEPIGQILPGLIAATGVDGTEGYVYVKDLEGEQAQNPEEAVEYMMCLRQEVDIAQSEDSAFIRYVPLYDKDGITIIGKIGVSAPLLITDNNNQ